MRQVVVSLYVIAAGFCGTLCDLSQTKEMVQNITISDTEHAAWGNDYDGSKIDEVQMSRAYMTGARLWPGGKVIYQIDKTISEYEFIRGIHIAAKSISEATCITFLNRTNTNSNQPYLQFYRFNVQGKPGCSSYIGFQNQFPQRVTVTPKSCNLHKSNYAGSVVHEAMHALGFLHEFQRQDREEYIHYTGKETGERFEVNYGIKPGDARSIPFNYKSIMQYDSNLGFKEVKRRRGGYPAPIGKFANMGQECKISAGDINLINRVYSQECKLTRKFCQSNPDGGDCTHSFKIKQTLYCVLVSI